MPRKKLETNRTILTKLIKELDDLELAFLRDRILTFSESVVKNKEKILNDNTNSFFHPAMYVKTMEKTYEIVKIKE